MARTSPFRKKPNNAPELDGCRSCCDTCPVTHICGGCTGICRYDSHKKTCPTPCSDCPARCWRRNNLDDWEFDLNGFDFNGVTCSKPFTGDLPAYLPQLRENIWGVEHPAYIINIAKLFNPKTKRLLFLGGNNRKPGDLRRYWQIPNSAKIILSFCCKDEYIDYIWANQFSKWSENGNFWETLAAYKFDAALSVDYSCFLDYPRLDHITNIKRNALTAQQLALAGIPVILDVMIANMFDLERVIRWGIAQNFKWYHMNFQKTFKIDWMTDIIVERCDKIFTLAPEAHIILSGIGDEERIRFFLAKYPHRIVLSSSNVSIYSNRGWIYNEKTLQWEKSYSPKQELFAKNLDVFRRVTLTP